MARVYVQTYIQTKGFCVRERRICGKPLLHDRVEKRIADEDTRIVLAIVQVLGPEDAAVETPGALDDHRVPEGDAVVLLEIDRSEEVAWPGLMNDPGRETLQPRRGLCDVQWVPKLCGCCDVELLEDLDAHAPFSSPPQLIEKRLSPRVFLARQGVVGVDQKIRIDELTTPYRCRSWSSSRVHVIFP